MKENYTVSFVKNDVNQCRLVKAESKEQALAYFAEIEPAAEICGAALDQCNLERRGCPVEIVPDGWTPAAAETETAEATETKRPACIGVVEAAAAVIRAKPARSAWVRGVKAYALELLENLDELTDNQLADPAAVRAALLKGAQDWQEYSDGGCSLIYNGDIAARVCTPSELKRTRNGERYPNSREIWLDVQARALSQAARLVCEAVKGVIA